MIPTSPQHAADNLPTEFSSVAIRTLIGGCIGMAMGASPILLLSFGIYQQAIVRETGWDQATIASSIGLPMVVSGLMCPLVGLLVNRFGPRRFITAAFPIAGFAVLLLSTAHSAAMFTAFMALAGVLVAGQTMIPFVYAVSGWFDRRRGLALGIVLACTGLGLAIMPPIAAQIIAHFGWRTSYFAFGIAMMLTGIPVGRWLITDPPAAAAVDRAKVPGVPWRTALASPLLWYLTISIMLVGGAVAGGMVNLSIILTSHGVTPQLASFVMSVVGVSMILARLVFGYLFDRVRPRMLTIFICIMTGAAFLLLATATGPVGVLIGAALIGIGFGAEGDALSYMISRAFGMRDFGIIFGMMFFAFTFGGGFGPILFAVLRKSSGSFQLPSLVAAAGCGLATLLIVLIRDSDLRYSGHRAKPAATIDRAPLPVAAE